MDIYDLIARKNAEAEAQARMEATTKALQSGEVPEGWVPEKVGLVLSEREATLVLAALRLFFGDLPPYFGNWPSALLGLLAYNAGQSITLAATQLDQPQVQPGLAAWYKEVMGSQGGEGVRPGAMIITTESGQLIKMQPPKVAKGEVPADEDGSPTADGVDREAARASEKPITSGSAASDGEPIKLIRAATNQYRFSRAERRRAAKQRGGPITHRQITGKPGKGGRKK